LWYNSNIDRKPLIFLRFLVGLIIALSIFWGFRWFIKDDNWLGVSSLATVVLAFVAALTIRQNQNIKRSERRERLLNEIIEWAVSIEECSRSSMNLPALSTLTDPTRVWTFAYATIGNLDLSLSRMELRSRYINQVVLIFSKNLQIAVKELTNNLAKHRKLISESVNTTLDVTTNKLSKFNNAADKVIAHELLLGKYVSKVIEEATKIKTRDTS